MKAVRIDVDALADVEQAVQWYDGKQAGLGRQFLDELEQVLSAVGSGPLRFGLLRGFPPELPLRRAALHRFPYAVVFMELQREVRVLAIPHRRQQPDSWLDRLQS